MLCYYMHLRIDCSLRRLFHPSHRQISKERFQVQPQLLLRNIIRIIIKYLNLGWALWNRNSFEFKFDDTRLSSYYKNKIGPIKTFLFRPDFAKSLPCWLSQFSWDSQQGKDFVMSGRNKKFLIEPILFLYYKESLVSSNLNSKLFRFHSAHPNVRLSFFCKSKWMNNGKHGQGTHCTVPKWMLIIWLKIPQISHNWSDQLFYPISLKKGFIGCPQSLGIPILTQQDHQYYPITCISNEVKLGQI